MSAMLELYKYFEDRYGNIDQNKEVATMVQSAYIDPKVEERGIKIGEEIGRVESIREIIHDFLSDYVDYYEYHEIINNELSEIKELERLRELTKVSARVDTASEFLQYLR